MFHHKLPPSKHYQKDKVRQIKCVLFLVVFYFWFGGHTQHCLLSRYRQCSGDQVQAGIKHQAPCTQGLQLILSPPTVKCAFIKYVNKTAKFLLLIHLYKPRDLEWQIFRIGLKRVCNLFSPSPLLWLWWYGHTLGCENSHTFAVTWPWCTGDGYVVVALWVSQCHRDGA